MKVSQSFFLGILFALLSTILVAEEVNEYVLLQETQSLEDFDLLLTDSYFSKFKKKRRRKEQKYVVQNTWRPFFVKNTLIQPKKGYFFQTNLGVGFLRFSGVSGGTSGTPLVSGQLPQYEIKGRLNYTRTPLFETNLGSQLCNWMALALAYQHQGVIDIQSNLQTPSSTSATRVMIDQFTANLRLDALFTKVYFNLPSSLIWKTIAYNLYLGIGGGICWQSWTNIKTDTYYLQGFATGITDNHVYSNKYSANGFYMFDLGFNMRSASPNLPFSARIGCKYNAWGQARNMGKQTQDNNYFSLDKPIRIKLVYQFAPYMGVQWNY